MCVSLMWTNVSDNEPYLLIRYIQVYAIYVKHHLRHRNLEILN